MTTTEQQSTYRLIDPRTIAPSPDNPRDKLRNIDKLAANIKENGFLEAITVIPFPGKGGIDWMVWRGHRRHAAALQLKLSEIPVIVSGHPGELRIAMARASENIQRDDFTVVERARAFQQILDLGATDEEAATGLSVPIELVQQTTSIAKSKLALDTAESKNLTFDQALAFAEFDGNEDATSRLLSTLEDEPADFEFEVVHLRQERARQLILSESAGTWEAKGYKVMNQGPVAGTGATWLGNLKVSATDKKKLTEALHTECPQRAVALRLNHQDQVVESEFCADWAAAGHIEVTERAATAGVRRETSGRPALDEKEAAEATLKRQINLACINASKAAEVVRRKFVSELLKRKTAPSGMLRFAIHDTMDQYSHQGTISGAMFAQLTGHKAAGAQLRRGGDYLNDEQTFLAKATEAALPIVLFARVAALIETEWETNRWNAGKDAQRKRYLDLLISCGYHPSLVEKIPLGKATGQDVLNAKHQTAAKTAAPAKAATSKKAAPVKKAAAKTAARKAPAKPVKAAAKK